MKAMLICCVLFMAAPVFAQDEDPHTNLFRASMVAAIAAHGADLASTEHCLGAQRCRELNQFLLRFDQPAAFGAAKMGLAAMQIWLVAKLHELFPKAAIAVNVMSAALFTGIAIHNGRAGQ